MNKLSIVIFIIGAMFTNCVKLKKVDLVIHNAKIYTVNESFDVAQAMAISDGEIVAIGKEHEIMNKYRADDFFDAQTRPIFPGFIDIHSHFIGYGLNKLGVDVSSCTNQKDLIKKIKEYEIQNPEALWLIGYGWNDEKWGRKIGFYELKDAFTKPLLIWKKDGHQLLVNDLALNRTNLDSTILKDGIVGDRWIPNFIEAISYTRRQKKQAIRLSQEECLRNGLTTVADAGITNDELQLLKQFEKNGNLDVKVYAMLKPTSENIDWVSKNGKYKSTYLHVCSFKFMADGSLGSRGACLIDPYNDVNTFGELLLSKEDIVSYAKMCHAMDYQMNVHCIGDSSFRLVTTLMGEVLKYQNDKRWRIEHAQVIHPKDIENLKKYSILASVQPTHGISDKEWAISRLGSSRLLTAYLLKTLKKQNGIIGFGTDFPVENMDPIKTFFNTVIRSKEKYLAKEKMSREEALKAMTFWAAMYNFEDYDKGSLEIGKKADFVILSHDIMKVPDSRILDTKVLFTFVNGLKMYEQ